MYPPRNRSLGTTALLSKCGRVNHMTEQHVTSADGTRIAYDRQGAGPLLLLVGGAFSERGDGAGLAALLAGHFTVICHDRRGRGGSTDTQPYALAREVEDIATLLALAPGGRVYGHSSGAVLTLHAALALPKMIERLALYEPPFIVDDSRAPMPADLGARLNAALAAGDRDGAAALFLTEAVGVPAGAMSHVRHAPSWPGQLALAHTLPYELVVLGDMANGTAAPLARFAGVHAHTLVIDGGASAPWAHHGADAIAAVLPHAARRTLAGQGHGADPAVLAPALLEFFGAPG